MAGQTEEVGELVGGRWRVWRMHINSIFHRHAWFIHFLPFVRLSASLRIKKLWLSEISTITAAALPAERAVAAVAAATAIAAVVAVAYTQLASLYQKEKSDYCCHLFQKKKKKKKKFFSRSTLSCHNFLLSPSKLCIILFVDIVVCSTFLALFETSLK